MTKRIRLKDENGDDLVCQAGESMNLLGSFADVSDTPLTLDSDDLLTITLDLFDTPTEATINSRSAQDVKNANGGTVTTAGAITVKLDPADAIIVGTLATGATEEHVARLTWTWNDGAARTGIAEYTFQVEQIASPS